MADGYTINVTPIGAVIDYAAGVAPEGWLLCDGSAVSRDMYSALFALLGTTFGVGDGSTTFNVPDTRGRTVVGAGNGAGLTARVLADASGTETQTLSVANLPAHHHAIIMKAGYQTTLSTTAGPDTALGTASGDEQTRDTGSGTAHNNMQPFVCLYQIIRAF